MIGWPLLPRLMWPMSVIVPGVGPQHRPEGGETHSKTRDYQESASLADHEERPSKQSVTVALDHYTWKPESSRFLKVQFAAVDRELAELSVVSALPGPGWRG
jgi:hypothetical protein